MAQLIEMPKLSDTMSVGTVVAWHKKKGDLVVNGDILAEIETDKATMELENFDDGVLLDIFVEEGSEAAIGSPLAVVGEEGEEFSELLPSKSDEASTEEGTEKHTDSDNSVEAKEDVEEDNKLVDQDHLENRSVSGGQRVLASPLAKKIAKEENIDLSSVAGSGPRGRIVRRDLVKGSKSVSSKAYTETSPSSFCSENNSGLLESKTVPVSKMRSVIASRLLESKTTIPHFYLQKEINAQPLRLAREAINRKLSERAGGQEASAPKISINDLVLKACAETIKWHPSINTSWNDANILFHSEVNLAFGVAIDDGLLTPVINNADQLSLVDLSAEAKSLISKARSKRLMPDEMAGSTFTVTNLGMFGIDFFSGIINPPNAAILSIGTTRKKPTVGSCGNILVGETMVIGLSCDHRLVDGAIAAQFLQSLSENLENPSSMLV